MKAMLFLAGFVFSFYLLFHAVFRRWPKFTEFQQKFIKKEASSESEKDKLFRRLMTVLFFQMLYAMLAFGMYRAIF